MEGLHKSGERDPDATLFLIANEFKDDPQKAIAISLRMRALAQLIKEGVPGWALPEQADGATPIRECVFAAAAVEQLIEIEGDARFEKNSFLRKAIEFAEMEGEA